MKKEIYLDLSQAPDTGLHTAYIQQALDQCRESGGQVVLGPGDWKTGSLRLYSDTTLRLRSGAHLLASNRFEDYEDYGFESSLGYLSRPHLCNLWNLPKDYLKAVITAVDAENVAVIGELGTSINGQDCQNPNGEDGFRGPMGMVFTRCKHITLQGYTIVRAGNWSHSLDSCEDLRMSDIQIRGGHNGIGIHHCKGFWIEGCDFRTGGDCLIGYDNENVLVRNCYLNTSCSCIRMGCQHLQVEGCRFWGPGEYLHRRAERPSGPYAFNYYSLQYDTCRPSKHWLIQDCTFEDIDCFFHYNYGGFWQHNGSPLKDITVDNCSLTGMVSGSKIHSTDNMSVTLRHVRASFRDGLPEDGLIDTNSQVRFHIRDLHVQGL